jgi:dTDP-4-amino-4,6-dideoxygalactose transaminase
VPFLDLGYVHRDLTDQLLGDFEDVIDSGCFTNGSRVTEFEQAFAQYCAAPWCVGMASGMDALRIALQALAVDPGSEVVVPANTFVATVEAIEQAGLTPVLVDAAERDYNCDVRAVSSAITSRTSVIVPVHLYGQMADMRPLLSLAQRHRVRVLEDACQAHGAERDGLRAGASGDLGAFSFYPGKNLGAMGDAGALVGADRGLAERAAALREHGQTAKYLHELVGYTARLDALQAAVLLRKLPLLDGWTAQRRRAAMRYVDGLTSVGDLRLPPVPAGSEPVWHLFEIRTSWRNELAAFLAGRGIQTGLHYPTPVHLTPAFAHLGYRAGDFPVAEQLSDQLLSLPIYPGLDDGHIDLVVQSICEYFGDD